MVKIAFYSNQLCLRGTTIALFDYAYYNKTLLNNESIIIYNTLSFNNNSEVLKKFKNHFQVIGIDNFIDIDDILTCEKCDILYCIKYGLNDGRISKKIKTCVHCVFTSSQPHGDVYASITEFVKGNEGKYPVVPHMINLPEHNRNMRVELGIPKNATVFGRHGGYNEFNIHYVKEIVLRIAKENPDFFFIFVNTEKFCETLPNIIHIENIVDLDKKVEFIQTCDAMIWGRLEGETFGLSIAEFSVKNKPVICTLSDVDNGHFYLLKDQAIWYNEKNLYEILTYFHKETSTKYDWNAFKNYTPEKVMEIFKKVFI